MGIFSSNLEGHKMKEKPFQKDMDSSNHCIHVSFVWSVQNHQIYLLVSVTEKKKKSLNTFSCLILIMSSIGFTGACVYFYNFCIIKLR